MTTNDFGNDDREKIREPAAEVERAGEVDPSRTFLELGIMNRDSLEHVARCVASGQNVELEVVQGLRTHFDVLATKEMTCLPLMSPRTCLPRQLRAFENLARDQSEVVLLEYAATTGDSLRKLNNNLSAARLEREDINSLRREYCDREHPIRDWHSLWQAYEFKCVDSPSKMLRFARLAMKESGDHRFDPLPLRSPNLIRNVALNTPRFVGDSARVGGNTHQHATTEASWFDSDSPEDETSGLKGVDPSQVDLHVDIDGGGFAMLPGRQKLRLEKRCLGKEQWHFLITFANNKGRLDLRSSRRSPNSERKYLHRIGLILKEKIGLSAQPFQKSQWMMISGFQSIQFFINDSWH